MEINRGIRMLIGKGFGFLHTVSRRLRKSFSRIGAVGKCPYCKEPIYKPFIDHTDNCEAFNEHRRKDNRRRQAEMVSDGGGVNMATQLGKISAPTVEPKKSSSIDAYAVDIDDLGVRITAIFRRHVWISQDDIAGLLAAKDCVNRIKGRMAVRG
jgi:hypothetical protein